VILDTSALLAVLFHEEDGEVYARAIENADSCSISAATFVELSMVVEAASGDFGIRQCDAFLQGNEIVIESFTESQARTARQGFSDYGKGRHAAGLNLGDCFSYALAKVSGEPLLFKGNDFRKTDVTSALP
jgi:ribonuclease VapC